MAAKTLSVILKEKFNDLPIDINDIKEINNFYKEALKNAVEENKSVGKKKKPSKEKNENGEWVCKTSNESTNNKKWPCFVD